MIQVDIRKDRISVIGHAGYSAAGQDIVCAAVSVLSQTLVSSIEELTKDRPEYTIMPGTFIFEMKNLSEKSKILIDSFFMGICGIINAYPDYVKIV